MHIIIPTVGRAKKQETLAQLAKAGLKPTLVVQARDYLENMDIYGEHRPYCDVYVLPPEITTIAPTRQHILEHVVQERFFCMVDDDLTFYKRRDDDRAKLRDIFPFELHDAFKDMEYVLEWHGPHVGFAAREGANRNTNGLIENTRIMRVLGYDRQLLVDRKIRFDRMEVMEDFDVALQLLEQGFSNWILNNYAHNQGASGAAGGCSTFRTPEMQTRNANLLHALHPKYVKVVEKTTKTAWGGGTRHDVVISWKRAYQDGVPF